MLHSIIIIGVSCYWPEIAESASSLVIKVKYGPLGLIVMTPVCRCFNFFYCGGHGYLHNPISFISLNHRQASEIFTLIEIVANGNVGLLHFVFSYLDIGVCK